MTRSLAAILAGAMVVGSPRPAQVWAQDKSDFAGRWTLNRELSQFPREIGFGVDWLSARGSTGDSTPSGGRGRRGSGGGGTRGGGTGAFTSRPESADDAKRVQRLTAEVRQPSAHLAIVESPTTVTITDDQGQSRTFHPDGRDDVLQLDGVSLGVTAKREAGRLVVLYRVEQGRELRYSYSRSASPAQLVVDVEFVERGGGDKVRRVYEPSSAVETRTAATPVPSASAATTTPAAG